MPSEFSPKNLILHNLHYWWVIAISMILGGMLGFGYHRVHPPVYQAKATVYAYIDYEKITDVNLTQYDEDITFYTFQVVMSSTDVIRKVINQMGGEGVILDYQTFINNMDIYRKLSDFEIYYRNTDPAVAAVVVNKWADIGIQDFNQLQESGKIPRYITVNTGSYATEPKTAFSSQLGSYLLAGAILGLGVGLVLTSVPIPIFPIYNGQDSKSSKKVRYAKKIH